MNFWIALIYLTGWSGFLVNTLQNYREINDYILITDQKYALKAKRPLPSWYRTQWITDLISSIYIALWPFVFIYKIYRTLR